MSDEPPAAHAWPEALTQKLAQADELLRVVHHEIERMRETLRAEQAARVEERRRREEERLERMRTDAESIERVREAYQHKLEATQAWRLNTGLTPRRDATTGPRATVNQQRPDDDSFMDACEERARDTERLDCLARLARQDKPIRIDVREGGGYVISRLAINPADSIPEITSRTIGETLREAIDDILIARDA